jgi:putative membrane protein
MIEILFIWIVTATGLWITTKIVRGVRAQSTGGLLLAALVLGLINSFIRPVLLLFTFPLTVFTFGLFALVINALMVSITAALVPVFEVKNFGSALLAALIMAILSMLGLLIFGTLFAANMQWMFWHGQTAGCGVAI